LQHCVPEPQRRDENGDPPRVPACHACEVSLVELIANPGLYDGTRVFVEGAVRIEFEGNAIYLSAGDLEKRIHKNAVWLEMPAADAHARSALDGKYVGVCGVFDANSSGHFGMYSGTINRITQFEAVRTSW
jgi:hypothetical protein